MPILTPDHMLEPKKSSVELKHLPKNLRYEFLDKELNCTMLVSENINRDKTN